MKKLSKNVITSYSIHYTKLYESYNEVFDGGDPIKGGEGIDIKEGCHDGIIHGNHVHGLTRRGLYIDASYNFV